MSRKYFLKSGENIRGPFSREHIITMIKLKELNSFDQVSPDKIHWFDLQEILRTLPTDLMDQLDSGIIYNRQPEPELSTPPENSETPPNNTSYSPPPPTRVSATAEVSPDCSRIRIFSDTIGAFINGSMFWQKIVRKGNAAMTLSSIIAIVTSLLLVAFGNILFIRHCQLPLLEYFLRTLVWLLSCGSIFFLGGVILRLADSVAAQRILHESLLTTALAMLSLSVLLILQHGVLFILLKSYSWQLFACVSSGLSGLFLLNAAVILRVSLLNSTRYGSGWSTFWAFTGCWLSFILYLFIIIPIYK